MVCGDDVYGGTFRLFDKVLKPMGIETTFVDMRHIERVEAAVSDKHAAGVAGDADQPVLKLFDIARSPDREAARACPWWWTTPSRRRCCSIRWSSGATVAMHSTTKYINGHSDVVGGALVTSDVALAERIKFLQNAIGAVPSPMDCYLVLRGLKTLPVRMRQHVKSAGRDRAAPVRGQGRPQGPLPRPGVPPGPCPVPAADGRALAG